VWDLKEERRGYLGLWSLRRGGDVRSRWKLGLEQSIVTGKTVDSGGKGGGGTDAIRERGRWSQGLIKKLLSDRRGVRETGHEIGRGQGTERCSGNERTATTEILLSRGGGSRGKRI